MTVTATPIVLRDVAGSPLAATPVLLRSCYLGATSIYGVGKEVIVALMSDQTIRVGFSLAGRFSLVDTTPLLDGGAVNITGIDVYPHPAGVDPAFPLLLVYLTHNSQNYCRVGALSLVGADIGVANLSPTGGLHIPQQAGGMAVRGTTEVFSPTVVGIKSQAEADHYMAFSWGVGWWGNQFSTFLDNTPETIAPNYRNFLDNVNSAWFVESPPIHPCRSSVRKGVRYSWMNLDVVGALPQQLMLWQNNTTSGGCRLMTHRADPFFSGLGTLIRSIVLREVRKGLVSILLGADKFQLPWDSVGGYEDTDVGSLAYYLKHTVPDTVSLGWGLSGDDIPVADVRIHGEPSLILVKGPTITIFGDGAGVVTLNSGSGTSPPNQPLIIDALVCSHSGSLLDPTGVTEDPLYRGKVVLVSYDKVYVSDTGLDFQAQIEADTPVLLLPGMIVRDAYAEEAYSVSLKYNDAEVDANNPAGWTLAVTYSTYGVDSGFVAQVYFSVDGVTWVIKADYDLSLILATAVPGAVGQAWYHSASAPDVLDLGLTSTSVAGVSQTLCFAGITVEDETPTITKYIVGLQGWWEWVTDAWVFVSQSLLIEDADFNTFNSSMADIPLKAAKLHLLSGDGFHMKSFERATVGVASSLMSVPVDMVPAVGFDVDKHPLWWSPEAEAATSSAMFKADLCLSIYLFESDEPVAVTIAPKGGSLIMEVSGTAGVLGAPYSLVEEVLGEDVQYDGDTVYPLARYTLAFYYSSQAHGTVVFLRSPTGLISHVMFSDPDLGSNFSLPTGSPFAGRDPTVLTMQPLYMGMHLTDVFADKSGTAVADVVLYLCDTGGRIYSLVGATVTLVSSALLEKTNLHLAKTQGMWVASYGVNASGVSVSQDLLVWQEVLAEGAGAQDQLLVPAVSLGIVSPEGAVSLDFPLYVVGS